MSKKKWVTIYKTIKSGKIRIFVIVHRKTQRDGFSLVPKFRLENPAFGSSSFDEWICSLGVCFDFIGQHAETDI